MGQRRTIELKFAGGLDERFSKKVLPDGLLRELHDQRMDQLGRIVRRPGRYMAGDDGDVLGGDATPKAVFEQLGQVSLLTPRRQYARNSAGTWTNIGPSATLNCLNTTPVRTLDVPVATYAPTDWTDACNVRRGVDECCSAAIAASVYGTTLGAYILVAQRSDVDLGTGYTLWGYVTLHGYHYWEDKFGLPHWEEVMRKTLTAHYASQLRVWSCGASLLCGFVTDEGTTWGMVLEKWAPRTALATVTETVLYTDLASDAPVVDWDVASTGYVEGGKSQYAIAASVGQHLNLEVLDEDNTWVHSDTDATSYTFERVAVCWNGSTSISVYRTYTEPTDYNHEVRHYTVHAVYISTTDLGDTDVSLGAPKNATLAVAPDSPTKIRVWWSFEVTQVGGTPSFDYYWNEMNNTAPYAATTNGHMHMPGRMMSKPFSWGSEQAAWFLTKNEDLSDRSYVLCRVNPGSPIEQLAPLAVASPNQAAHILSVTKLSEVSFVDLTWATQLDRWFWCAPETYTGSVSVTAPDVAPRVHAWGVVNHLPDPVVVDGQQVWSCEGVPALWGPGGRQEIQPVMGPGLMHATVDTGTGNVADGTYYYRAVYRVIRADGTVVRSMPGPVCAATMASGPGHMRLFLRPPSCTCIAAGTDSAAAIYVDVYRTPVGGGSLYYFAATATIPPNATYAEYELDDYLADASITSNEVLYTIGTNDIPCAGIPSFSTMRAHGGRIFGAHGRRLWYSTQRASNVGCYFPAGAYLECESDITAFASTEMGLVVFTRSSTWLLYGDGPGPNLQPFWAPLRLLSRDVGCVSQCSVFEWRDGVLFQSDRGLEILRKTGQIELHSGKVQEQLAAYPVVRRVLESRADRELRFLCATAGAWPGDTNTPGCLSRWLIWDYGTDLWRTEEAMGMADAATVVGTSGEELFEIRRTGANSLAGWQCWRALYWYDQLTSSTYSYPVRILRTGTIRPGGVGGWGRLRRVRVYGEPAVYNSGMTGNKVIITIRQHSEVDAEVTSSHPIEVRSPLYGATAGNVLLEAAPANQLCSEFDIQLEEYEPDTTEGIAGSLFVHCGCSDTSDHALTGLGTIDGVTLVEGVTVVALLAQNTASQNGAWVAKNAGWTRAPGLPAGATAESYTLKITAGTARANTYWAETLSPSVVGSNDLRYVQVNSSGDGLAGEGTAWTALAFDWEDLANRPRTTSLMRA
jgi:hypothetical protein